MFVYPFEAANPETVAWLAGLFEGEGSFMAGPPSGPRSPIVAISMTDRDIITRVAVLLGVKPQQVKERDERWRDAYAARARGRRAVAFMHAVRPWMGVRRQAQIDRALASYAPDPRRVLDDDGARTVLARLAAGERVADIASSMSISIWSVYDLRLNRTYRHLERPQELQQRRRYAA